MAAHGRKSSRYWPLVGTATLAVAFLAGCSGDMPGLRDVKMPSVSTLLPSNVSGLNQESVATKPITAADYVDANGNCAGGEPAAEGETVARGVGLSMTECQVVQRLGPPQATDISSNERGDRVVTMTYLSTDRAGLYRFVGGRLKSIERAPGSPQPEQPKKPKRHSRSNDPA